MPRDGGDEGRSVEGFPQPLRGVVTFAAVDDFAGFGQVVHLFERKGIAQNVLGEFFQAVVVVSLDAAAGMNAEAAMVPLAHLFRFLGGELALFREELEHADAKQFGDLFPIPSMQGVEGMRADEGAVGNEDVQMGVEVQVVAEGLYGDDHAWLAGGRSESHADDVAETQPGRLAETGEKLPIELECFSEPLGEGDDDLPVGDLLGDFMADEFAELLDPLLVAGGTEVSLLAA